MKIVSLIIFIVFSEWALSSLASGFEWQGDMTGAYSSMPNQNLTDVTATNSILDLNMDSKYVFNKQWNVTFHPIVIYDSSTLSKEERNQFEIQDFALVFKKASLRLKLGVGTVNWEGTDVVNPMDLLSAKNWVDPLSPIARGAPGLFYSDQVGAISWDFVFIPQQVENRLPGEKSAWWPRHFQLPTENENTQLTLPDQVSYQMQSSEILDHALTNNAAIRWQYHAEGIDFSLAASEGSSPTPFLIPTVNAVPVFIPPTTIYQLQSPILLMPLYYRQRTEALGAVATLKNWILRFAAQSAQTVSVDQRLPTNSSSEVLALEKTVEWGRSQSLTWILQGVLTQKPNSSNVSLVSSLTEKALMAGWRWPFREKWTWSTIIYQEQKYLSMFAHSELTWSFSDTMNLSLLADGLTGSSQSVLGLFEDNDRYTIKLKYLF